MKVLIAIPVHNELAHVRRVLAAVRKYHDQILVVDDGSTDGTDGVLYDLAQLDSIHLVRHPINQGYGQSIIDAFAWADQHGYEWVITMDCDEQHEPSSIPRFLREIGADRWDIVSGSRYLPSAKEDDLPPADRRAINAQITRLLNELLGVKLTDAFCGFKAHRVEAMKRLRLDERGYAFPLQLWPRAVAAGLRIKEIPVRRIYNDLSRSFGGNLDDAQVRLRHYLEVLERELKCPETPAGRPACGCEC